MNIKKIVTIGVALCFALLFMSRSGTEAYANEITNENDTSIIVEYDEIADISETIQSESNTLYIKSYVKVGDIYQAVYGLGNTSEQSSRSPRIVVSVSKEVIKIYPEFTVIPSSISYEEYNDTYKTWMKGTLFVQKAQLLSGQWTVIYKGDIIGHI